MECWENLAVKTISASHWISFPWFALVFVRAFPSIMRANLEIGHAVRTLSEVV